MEKHNNSVIYRNVFEDEYINFSALGAYGSDDKIRLSEHMNGFKIGDAIYYDFKTKHYKKALAKNSIMSEVIGLVSEIHNLDEFSITLKGLIQTDRYDGIENGTVFYLSDVIPGRLTEIEPSNISKIIGNKTTNGIYINIQRGYHLSEKEIPDIIEPRRYTKQEIQDVIDTVMKNIY